MTYSLSVVAEFREPIDAKHWSQRLANASLVDDRTLSLKWPQAHITQAQRMRDLMSQLKRDGVLVTEARVIIGHGGQVDVPKTRKARNAFKAMIRFLIRVFVRRGPVFASDSLAQHRLSICEQCRHFRNNSCVDVILDDGTVEQGCGCNLPYKTKIKAEACPLSHW